MYIPDLLFFRRMELMKEIKGQKDCNCREERLRCDTDGSLKIMSRRREEPSTAKTPEL